MAQVFISYAQQDRSRVRSLVEALEGQGLTVFWDPKLRAGEMYRIVLRSELDAAACVVAVWSTTSVRSDWVIWEASHGKRRKILVPVLIDDLDALELPPEFSGQHAQRIDVGQAEFAEHVRRFVEDVIAVVGPSDQPARPRTVLESNGPRQRVPRWTFVGAAGAVAALGVSYWLFIGSKVVTEDARAPTAATSVPESTASEVIAEPVAAPLPEPSGESPPVGAQSPPQAVDRDAPIVATTSRDNSAAEAKPSEAPATSTGSVPPPESASAASSLLNGSGESEYKLARQYEIGEGTAKNEAEALKLYRKAVEAGFEPALLPLARMLRDGRGGPGQPAEAVGYFQELADRGDVDAQLDLAMAYFEGNGIAKNEALGVKWLTAAAKQGDRVAQNNLGRAYALGLGVEVNAKVAAEWYYKAAAQGHAVAQLNLGEKYRLGLGVRQSDTEAFSYYLKAARQGDSDAANRVGQAYFNGTGVVSDIDEARSWFQRSADQGNRDGQSYLAELYEREKNYAKAVHWYEKSAEQNQAAAQTRLGLLYQQGNGVPKDRSTALKLYRLAANQGYAPGQAAAASLLMNSPDPEEIKEAVRWAHASASSGIELPGIQTIVGFAHETGTGLARDDAAAVKWYRAAAEQGEPAAQAALGRMLSSGRGVERNEREGLEWYRKAAEQGSRSAEYALGLAYLNGNSVVSKDPTVALGWFKKAMDHGHSDAKMAHAVMLMGEAGVAADKPEAVRLLQESAEQGNNYAATMLGSLYEKGDGVTKSVRKAKEWYALAANRGHAPAQKELDRLGK